MQGSSRKVLEALTITAGLLSLFICAGGASARKRVPIIPAGERFTCTAITVWDGDGPIWCREGPRIRLAGIAAREIDNTCRRGHPCPAATGVEARDALVRVLGGATGRTRFGHVTIAPVTLQCLSHGSGKGSRTAASCRLGGIDIAAQLLARHTVAAWAHRC